MADYPQCLLLIVIALLCSIYEESLYSLQAKEPPPPTSYTDPVPESRPAYKTPKQNNISCFAEVEFLYWTARLDTLTFAQTGVGHQDENASALFLKPPSGRNHTVNWQWDPGFKVKIGHFFNRRNWEANLAYLWFYTQAREQVSFPSLPLTPTTYLLAPVHPNSVVDSNGAQANWSLHYQLAAIALKRNYSISNFFKISPNFSLLGTWQKQKYRVYYDQVRPLIPNDESDFNSLTQFKHSSWGIGPCIGFHASWQFNPCVGVYSNLALGGLWCHYQTRRVDALDLTFSPSDASDDFQSSSTNLKDTIKTVKPFIDAAAGLFIDPSVNWSHYKLLFHVGWETHIWPSQTLYIQLYDHLSRFDLTLHGLTAQLRLEF